MSRKSGESAKYWQGILYPENMRADWQDEIYNLIQKPFAYCRHNKDKLVERGERKDHVHLIIVWDAPTTKTWALYVFNLLSDGKKSCCSTIEPCIDIRHCYDYLIHDTEDARRKGKVVYSPEFRICGNGFDIGAYEQISAVDKIRMTIEIQDFIESEGITDYFTLGKKVAAHFDLKYYQLVKESSGHFKGLVNGFWQYRLKNGKKEDWEKFDKFTEEKDITPSE